MLTPRFGTFVAGSLLFLGWSALDVPVVAQTSGAQSLPPNVQVVADGLLNPRGFTWGPDGNLYVAEAGSPPPGYKQSGPTAPGSPPITNSNGRISRIDANGERTTIAEGLPVSVGRLGDTIGPASVAFTGGQLYAIISAGPAHGHAEFAGGVYSVGSDGSVQLIADMDSFNTANPPVECGHCGTPGDELSNPYDMVAWNARLYVSDGNKDVIDMVDPAAPEEHRISRFADLSANGHKVLTGMAVGSDGYLYVTNLSPAPFAVGASAIWRLGADGSVTEISSGFSYGTGIAVSPDGAVYVAEIASAHGAPPFLLPPGRIATLGAEGVDAIVDALLFPTALRWGPDGLYTTARGVFANDETGSILRIMI